VFVNFEFINKAVKVVTDEQIIKIGLNLSYQSPAIDQGTVKIKVLLVAVISKGKMMPVLVLLIFKRSGNRNFVDKAENLIFGGRDPIRAVFSDNNIPWERPDNGLSFD